MISPGLQILNNLLFGVRDVLVNGVSVTARSVLNVTGGAVVSDNPLTKSTEIDVSSAGTDALPSTASSFFGVTTSQERGHLSEPSVVGDAIQSVIRCRIAGTGGGSYGGGGGQTAYPAYFADIDTACAGQQIGLFAAVRTLGKGNGLFGCSVVEMYGGGDVSGGDGTPECSPVGEFECFTGLHVFRATVAGTPAANATTIAYASPSDEDCLGCRVILNTTKKYTTGTYQSIDGTGKILTFAGQDFTAMATATGVALNSGNWYLKLASTQEGYSGAAAGDDVNPHDTFGLTGTDINIGHWYRVIDGDAHTLTLEVLFDVNALTCTPGTTYMLCQGAVPTAVDPVVNTITIPANTMHWSNSDTLVSGPNHLYVTNGINIIINSLFRSGNNAGNGQGKGLRLINYGPQQLAFGIYISGRDSSHGGFFTAITVRDMTLPGFVLDSSLADSQGYIERSSTDGGRNVHYMGSGAQTGFYYNDIVGDESRGALTFVGKVAFRTGVANAGGARHGRVTTGSIGASSTVEVTLTWASGWGDTNYTLVPQVEDASGYLEVVNIKSTATGSAIVRVKNSDGANPHTGTLHYHAFHD